MLGTAFPADRILLVEQPGGWGRDGLAASRFDRAVAAQLIERLGRRNIRVLAIRRPGRHPEPVRRQWIFADCRSGRQRLFRGSFDADDELLRLDVDAVEPATDQRPVYAICAHGTHDMCCAIEGRPVAAALDRFSAGRAWECSHVGGDRFAANVLVLPTGQQYGQITDAAELATATEAGRVLPERLRGQIGLAPAAQAGVVHAQRELGLTDIGAVRPVGLQPGADGAFQVEVAAAGSRYLVGVQRVAGTAAMLTCRAPGPRTPISFRPLWLRSADPATAAER